MPCSRASGRRSTSWFAISDSLPLASIKAERAAHQIIDACRRGDAELIITVQAKLAILARNAAPELLADAMASSPEGDEPRAGRESESAWAPSTLTTPTYEAAARNNEM
jgi:hypothetical protein